MKYVSTRDDSKGYNFEQVFIKGLADDGGLYVPLSLKKYSSEELHELKKLNYNELSTEIINQFSSDFISKEALSSLIKKSYSFELSLVLTYFIFFFYSFLLSKKV